MLLSFFGFSNPTVEKQAPIIDTVVNERETIAEASELEEIKEEILELKAEEKVFEYLPALKTHKRKGLRI